MTGRYRHARTMRLMVHLALVSCAPLRAQDRMPPIPADKMTEAQKKAAAEFAAARNSAPTGPFAVLLRVPELMDLGFRWRQHVQARSALDHKSEDVGGKAILPHRPRFMAQRQAGEQRLGLLRGRPLEAG